MSASQKALPSPRRRGTTSSKGAERKRSRIRPRTIALALAVVLVGAAAIVPIRLWLQQQEDLRALRAQTAEIQEENLTLQAKVKRLQDPAYLEQLARACLGMVHRGETAFVVIPKGGGSGIQTVPCEIAVDPGDLAAAAQFDGLGFFSSPVTEEQTPAATADDPPSTEAEAPEAPAEEPQAEATPESDAAAEDAPEGADDAAEAAEGEGEGGANEGDEAGYGGAIEVGADVFVDVTRITPYGAFVTLTDGRTGLIHISEIDRNYVKDIREHVREGDRVEARITAIKEDGKIDLSIKAMQNPQPRMQKGRDPEFESMLKKFMRSSDERQVDFKRSQMHKRR